MKWLTALAKKLMIAIICRALAFNYPGAYNAWKTPTCIKINNLHSQFGIRRNIRPPCGVEWVALLLWTESSIMNYQSFSPVYKMSSVSLNHSERCNFHERITSSKEWNALNVSSACEWSFHSSTGKKTQVWIQLTFFALLPNWPAREISHWNGVTVNVHYPSEWVVRGSSVASISGLFKKQLCLATGKYVHLMDRRWIGE